VDYVAPVLVEGIIEYANFLRRHAILRQGHGILLETNEVAKVYESGLLRLEERMGVKPQREVSSQETKEDGRLEDKEKTKWKSDYAFLSIHYAKFQTHSLQNISLARAIYSRAVSIVLDDPALWLAYINFEASQPGIQSQTLVPALYERALENLKESKDVRAAVGELYLSFLRDRGTSIFQVKQVRDKLKSGHFDEVKTGDSRKRKLEASSEEIEYGDRLTKVVKQDAFQPISTTFSTLASQAATTTQADKPQQGQPSQSGTAPLQQEQEQYAAALAQQQQYWSMMMGQLPGQSFFPSSAATTGSTASSTQTTTAQAGYMQFPGFSGVAYPQQWAGQYY